MKQLVKLHQSLNEILAENTSVQYWKALKLKEIEDLIGLCSGLYVEANLNGPTFSPGDQTILTSTLISKYASEIIVKSIAFPDIDSTLDLTLEANKLFSIKHPFKLSQFLPYSNPYWLNADPQGGLYTVKNQKNIGVPENLAALNVKFNVSIAGSAFTFVRPVAFKSVDPVKGEIYRPVEILPQVTINSAEKVLVFTDKSPKKATFIIKSQSNNVKGSFRLDLPKGWSGTINQTDFELLEKGTELSITATISASKTATNGSMKLFALVNNDTLSYSIQRIDYDHIPQQFILSESGVKLILVPMQSVGEKIAYIPGAGDDVAACLEQIGFSVTLLSEADLTNGNLAQYKSIITGVRAYNTNTRLTALHTKLMEYVKNGGNLIVQYNTNSRVGPIGAKIGPYPFTISRNRVTDEKAEVRFINPNHSVLNFPNKISTSDFENWIQERGIYFASELDSNYQTILAMNDPKEQDETGSLIVGQFGKGHFIYTGLAFFRELPAGVPGAYRLFVNLISIPNAK